MYLARIVLVPLGLLSLAHAPARADTANQDLEDAAAWALVTMELGAAGLIYAKTHGFDDQGWKEAVAITAPVALGLGLGLASHLGDWSPSVPHAAHGAGWLGVDLFLIGGLLAGDQDDGFHAGTLAWSLGALGALAGGYIGATQIDPGSEAQTWLGMQLSGLTGAFGVLAVLIAQSWDDSTSTRVAGWSTAAGLTLGLGIGCGLAFAGERDSSISVQVGQPAGAPAPRSLMLGWSGSFH